MVTDLPSFYDLLFPINLLLRWRSVSVEVIPASKMAHPGRRPVEYVDYIDTVDIPGISTIYTITMYRLVKRVVTATLKFQKNSICQFSM